MKFDFERCSKICRMKPGFIKTRIERKFCMKIKVRFLECLAEFFLKWEMFQTKVCKKKKFIDSITFLLRNTHYLWDKFGKTLYKRTGHRRKHGECTLYALYLRLQTHAQNMKYLLLFHYNSNCTNVPQSYILLTLKYLLQCLLLCLRFIQGDQNVSVRLMITVQKTSKNILNNLNTYHINVVRISYNRRRAILNTVFENTVLRVNKCL
jgi:hypothetical protein